MYGGDQQSIAAAGLPAPGQDVYVPVCDWRPCPLCKMVAERGEKTTGTNMVDISSHWLKSWTLPVCGILGEGFK